MKNNLSARLSQNFEAVNFFNRIMDLFFKLLILFVMLALGIGLVRLFLDVWKVMGSGDLKEAFGFIVTNLLTFFIILELFKSLVEYFQEHRLRLTFIVDATLVFILREVMVGLYQHQSSPLQLAALALMALVLGAVRTLAVIYSPMERRLVEHLERSPSNATEQTPGRSPIASRHSSEGLLVQRGGGEACGVQNLGGERNEKLPLRGCDRQSVPGGDLGLLCRRVRG